ncbi:hypothetical protein Ccrd_010484 [Cynara cardunculus var. scolymus]|uniref:Ribosomal protein S21e n=1 Tax=Cynara cardunculus var. scolymus TaxID=59895 RepID=A0A103YL72_CYNCS|nr:hypothetical protein Ccrd_010484 [Cynara cardunculus var. scolymus]
MVVVVVVGGSKERRLGEMANEQEGRGSSKGFTFLGGRRSIFAIRRSSSSSSISLTDFRSSCCVKKSPRCRMRRDKTSATNRLITSKDHASVQINVGHVDETGRYTGQFSTFALCGFVRAQGDADSALDRLWQKKKVEARQ